MAKKDEPKKRTLRPGAAKKTQTVRQRATSPTDKPRRVRAAASKVAGPLQRARKAGKREVDIIPLPDNKAGRFLKRRVRFVPKFFSEAFTEIRQVTWPTGRDTIRLTMAVFIFAVLFSIFVGFLDFVLDKIFREFILN